MNADSVKGWIGAAEAELELRAEEAEKAQARLSEARKKLALLHELLASIAAGSVTVAHGAEISTRERVERDVESILADVGHPMRLQEIHTEFVRRGLPLPGRGTPTNVLTHLVQSKRVVRVGRGVYGLAAWPAAVDSESEHEVARQS